jgi:hypothetical protein
MSRSRGPADIARSFHCDRTTVYRTLKRFGFRPPDRWRGIATEALEANRSKVPDVIIRRQIDRAWAASLFGGEGCIAANYKEKYDRTYLVTALRMSDKGWVDRFGELVGRPVSGERRHGVYKTQWDKTLAGLRALKFLEEILPYLYGNKRAEAMRAIEFFSPKGYRPGKHSSLRIWPSSEFPLRKRPLHPRLGLREKQGSTA